MKTTLRAILCFSLFTLVSLAQEGRQQFASLGDFKLVSGEVIRDCRLGYRTFGQMNADKSNAILFPTWLGGTTKDLASSFAPGNLVDTSKYFVIAVDALGDGVSSSPSNSEPQPRMKFPKFAVKDMVSTEHQLLTQVLHISHVKAVMGISMGGMQTFQWMVSYPDFMDKAIPIVGSPRLAAYDLMLWQTENDALMNNVAWNHGDYQENPAKLPMAEFGALMLTTPQRYNQQTTRAQVFETIAKAKTQPESDANDHIRQTQAMMDLDVPDAFGGSMERAAAAVKAKVLIVVSSSDHMVTPGPARDFGKLLGAQMLDLPNDCGHLLSDCENPTVIRTVNEFLGQ
jgi:homoserine O-acetyltransferase/O-succinyltransferase